MEERRLQHMLCSCQDWKTSLKQPDADPQLLRYYDHSSYECNDDVSAAVVRSDRQNFQKMAVDRLVGSLGTMVKSSVPLPPLEAWTRAYGEMAIFCDVYRYQFDFLGEQSHSLSPVEASLSQFFGKFRADEQVASNLRARALTKVLERLGSAAEPPRKDGGQRYAHFRTICQGFTVFDGFRCQVDGGDPML